MMLVGIGYSSLMGVSKPPIIPVSPLKVATIQYEHTKASIIDLEKTMRANKKYCEQLFRRTI